MGLSSILDLFKKDNWSNELVARIGEMLDTAAEMFGYVVGILVYGEENDDPQGEVYDRDIRINHLEREIRRRVISRLALKISRAEIPTALIFMNAVKDVERIGDYNKNLYEIISLQPKDIDRALYQEYLVGRSRTIEDLFARTLQSFSESDQEKARDVISRAKIFGKQAEQVIAEITRSYLRTPDAVCLVLTIRFYTRIVAHMSNVATTVVMPVDLLDFYDEPAGGEPRGD
jgi:phosphate transport system protein